MPDTTFIAYVGDPDFHDGSILTVDQDGGTVSVRVRGASGRVFVVEFTGVGAVKTNCPEGMLLYALTEVRTEPPMRRFVFANWDYDSKAQLEVDAAGFSVHEE